MSPQANRVVEEDIDLNNPKEHEKLFLQDRGLLGDERVPVVFQLADGTVVSNDPNQLRENFFDESRIQALVEARAHELAADMLAQQQAAIAARNEDTGHTGSEPRGGTPVPGSGAEEDEDDEEVEYEDMNTDDLRAEIARRNQNLPEAEHMSVSGRKAELIERLEAYDAANADEDDEEGEGG